MSLLDLPISGADTAAATSGIGTSTYSSPMNKTSSGEWGALEVALLLLAVYLAYKATR